MSKKNIDYPIDLEELSGEEDELLPEPDEIPTEDPELPANFDKMPEFEFLLRKKSREFIFETIPKIQESKQCGPRMALHILARTEGYKRTFLHDDKAIKELHNIVTGLNINFPSKSTLANYLAINKDTIYSFRQNDQLMQLIIDVPGLTGELKQARFKANLKLQMQDGHHEYYFNPNTTKTVTVKPRAVRKFIEDKVREVLNDNWYGFDKVTLVFHTPIDFVDHFMQSIIPQAEISSRYGDAILSSSPAEKKEGKFKLRIRNLKAHPLDVQYISQNKQKAYIVSFNTNAANFMEKITIIHAFVSKMIEENAHLNHQIHKFVQVERDWKSGKYMHPFTICINPFSFSDYYYSKYRNIHNLFFSFPKEIGDPGVIADRVILIKRDKGQLSSLENLLKHNKEYMRSWSIRLLRNCIEETRMISTERLRQFLGDLMNPYIDQLINQLESVYEQRQKEVDYYAEKERERQAKLIRRLGYLVSALFALFTILQGISISQWFLSEFLSELLGLGMINIASHLVF
ncbi:MAG: hypothetical protein ACFFC7_09530 [Candidatus Hermodarchaeota archaeon]